jgi:hypothetical protein
MSRIIRWTLPLVAYLCVGTVISAALGYGYLRRSGRLDDETMFRIMALLHGLDLKDIEQSGAKTADGTPPEEPSFADKQQQLQAAKLHFDAKQKQLSDSLVDFDYMLKQVSEATARYADLRGSVEKFLREQQQIVNDESLAKVRELIESLIPKKQAKPILIEMIKGGEIDHVVLILGGLKPGSRRDILRTFTDEPQDILFLDQIRSHMLNDNPAKPIIEQQLNELQKIKGQEK